MSSMTVVLFGAGASYGSEKVSPYPPPLSKDLYHELGEYCPEVWGAIPDRYKQKFEGDFEAAMGELWESGSFDGPALMRCMAHYFTQFSPNSENIYNRFLKNLDRGSNVNDIVFSSLNYECVFELAARQSVCSKINYFGDRSEDGLTVWKIHGSCNFLSGSIRGSADSVSYSGDAVTWRGELQIAGCRQARKHIAKNAFFPAMALFASGKPVYSHPDQIESIQSKWSEAVLEADMVAVVGAAVNPADDHIWDPLAETSAQLLLVGDLDQYERWDAKERDGGPTIPVGRRFESSFAKLADLITG